MRKLKSKPVSSVIRRSVALPKALVREALSLAPTGLRENLNRLMRTALEQFVDAIKERRIDEEMIAMGKDPHILAECRKINAEFAQTDSDGLTP